MSATTLENKSLGASFPKKKKNPEEQKERKEEQNKKTDTQPKSTREQEVLLFFSSCNVLLPSITAAVKAAREPDGNVNNPGSLASSFLQVQEEIGQRLMQSIH